MMVKNNNKRKYLRIKSKIMIYHKIKFKKHNKQKLIKKILKFLEILNRQKKKLIKKKFNNLKQT